MVQRETRLDNTADLTDLLIISTQFDAYFRYLFTMCRLQFIGFEADKSI